MSMSSRNSKTMKFKIINNYNVHNNIMIEWFNFALFLEAGTYQNGFMSACFTIHKKITFNRLNNLLSLRTLMLQYLLLQFSVCSYSLRSDFVINATEWNKSY